MRRFCSFLLSVVFVFASCCCLSGCDNSSGQSSSKELFVVGFSQVGSESDWRLANTKSMTETFTEANGYELRLENAKQQQENQFLAIRNFILEGVDCIVLAPTIEEGWENVLTEVKDAGIPVIILDRSVSVSDSDLFLSNFGSDFLKQGSRSVEWLESQVDGTIEEGDTLKILHLQGTYGATAQILRTKAIEVGVAAHKDWEFTGQLYGDFTEAKGYEVVSDFLRTNKDIDVLYSENDNMTFGAMRAFDDYGITYGEGGQVKIITFDATKKALQYCLDGKINLCAECNPLQGPGVEQMIRDLRAGKKIPKHVYAEESIFTKDELTQEFIDGREY